ncbi:phosphatase [Candidatus Solincola sp.]|nr:phosphatase [Actinomycetota bacterium]MDI7253357.1 phosphatase [Actinomycetota bacterium]
MVYIGKDAGAGKNQDLTPKVDLHVHTVSSGHAYSTVEECARWAAGKGLQAIAVTDHGPAVPGSGNIYHFWNLKVIPRRLHGVVILRSVEANILDTRGTLDLPDKVLAALDVVHAGLHPYTGYQGEGVEENTAALLAAIRHPLVDIIVHPDNPAFPVDMEVVVEAAVREGKALEVNNSSFTYTRSGSEENCRRMARLLAEKGGLVAVGSDAHVASFAGEFGEAIEVLRETDITPSSVINYSLERLEEFLARRGKPLRLE